MALKNKFIIFGLILISILLHLFNLNQPRQPVFDEVHFATYAGSYANREAHMDIHPPLGKIIYALPLFLEKNVYEYQFLKLERNNDEIVTRKPVKFYDKFPYLKLRTISAFFGIFLILAVYLFLRAVTKNELAAILAAGFLVFENSIILETRLILLNGMFLAFGFMALYFFFKNRPHLFLAGLFWGAALSVKLIAIVFLAPVFISMFFAFFRKKEINFYLIRSFLMFFITGMIFLFLGWILINNLLINSQSRISLYENLFDNLRAQKETQGIVSYATASTMDFLVSFSGYVAGVKPHIAQSNWYAWPLMFKPVIYFGEGGKTIALIGNYFVWLLSTAMLGFLIINFKKYLVRHEKREAFWILLGGYVFSLLPFVFVKRPAFLYHYFPALIFAIGITSLIIGEHLKTLDTKNKKILIGLILFLTISGFLLVAPYTYGF